MTYHAFKETCFVCDGTGGFVSFDPDDQGSVLKCQSCRGEGTVEGGSFETFVVTNEDVAMYEEPKELGWYWWACFPGCLPDGDPSGPFATEQEAIDDANRVGG